MFLQVQNSGPVVPADVVPLLFEPFRRVAGRDGTRDGAGLRLSIVQSVAQAHGASVSVRSQPAGGLNVLVVIPRICPGSYGMVSSGLGCFSPDDPGERKPL